MRTLVFTPAALALAFLACQQAPRPPADQPQHALLDDLEPPPVNQPLSIPPPSEVQAAPQLPTGDQPVLMIVREGRPFSGTLEASGELAVGDTVIEFRPQEGAPIRILYRRPKGLPAPAVGSRSGRIDLAELGGPEGADRYVALSDDAGLLLAQVWRQSAEPLRISLPGGLRLVQRAAARADTAAGYAEAPVTAVVDGQAAATLQPGQPTGVETRAGTVQLLAQTSHRFVSGEDELGQYPSNYIVHVWVIRAE